MNHGVAPGPSRQGYHPGGHVEPRPTQTDSAHRRLGPNLDQVLIARPVAPAGQCTGQGSDAPVGDRAAELALSDPLKRLRTPKRVGQLGEQLTSAPRHYPTCVGNPRHRSLWCRGFPTPMEQAPQRPEGDSRGAKQPVGQPVGLHVGLHDPAWGTRRSIPSTRSAPPGPQTPNGAHLPRCLDVGGVTPSHTRCCSASGGRFEARVGEFAGRADS